VLTEFVILTKTILCTYSTNTRYVIYVHGKLHLPGLNISSETTEKAKD